MIFSATALSLGILFAATSAAYAYPVVGSTGSTPVPTINGFNFDSLTVPFQNFVQSIQNSANSIGNPAGSLNAPSVFSVPSMPQNGSFTNWIQSGFQQFDAWLYGIAGFHISGLIAAVLHIFSWLLGAVKGAVDWLLNIIH